jgi:hypothetical protein
MVMPGRRLAASVVTIVCTVILLTVATACSSSTTTSGNGSPPTSAAATSAAATSTAVAKAKAQLDTCIKQTGVTALLQSAGRTQFVNCMKSLVPPAKQEQFKTCLTNAVKSDKLWTSAGRSKFTNESLVNCVNAAAA